MTQRGPSTFDSVCTGRYQLGSYLSNSRYICIHVFGRTFHSFWKSARPELQASCTPLAAMAVWLHGKQPAPQPFVRMHRTALHTASGSAPESRIRSGELAPFGILAR